jgi:hypothetical protein
MDPEHVDIASLTSGNVSKSMAILISKELAIMVPLFIYVH